VYDSFEGDYLATIGTDIHVKMVDLGDFLVKLVIWDIAGQDDFAQLRKAYYQNASGAFFVWDTTRPETFDRVEGWVDGLFGVTKPIPLVLLENKIDLESNMPEGAIKPIAEKYGVDLVRTSAKDDTNVEEAFKKMTMQILEKAKSRSAE
jgi:small GTP-binding protein